LVLTFAEAELTEDLEYVYEIFRRKGAYSRFKDLVERRGKLQQWYEYEENRKKEALRLWSIERGIQIDG
jgi:RIO-like serine/threonine protein kinase